MTIQSTPFRMTFGLEAVRPIKFQIPSLWVQVTERLTESKSEHHQLEQLLELRENRLASMAQLEHQQRQCKEFVDCHRKGTEKSFAHGKLVSPCYARACRIRRDHGGLGLGSEQMGRRVWAKGGEINMIEKIEGDKVYKAMYIMGSKAARRLQPGPQRLHSKHKKQRNPNRMRT